MGGEGATWIGQAPYSQLAHVFANLGDGTYFHSGLLAIRAAVAANVNITYKILFNDAVAMTGGQPLDGQLDVAGMAHQLRAEGLKRIAIVAEKPDQHRNSRKLPEGVTVHDRRDLDAVQRELREVPGVTALIYDQTCAAEKRRRRKKEELLDPPRRLFINEAVCEGCGDCGIQSNCTSLLPTDTPFGRKRQIDQSSCNKDYSCLQGFCPSFVTVLDAEPRKRSARGHSGSHPGVVDLPEVLHPPIDQTYNIYVAGIGGTGVITIGALLGMAAHLEGKGVSVLDMTGMSQKNGSVVSHVRIMSRPGEFHSQRIPTGEADLILGCDLLAAGAYDSIAKTHAARTFALVNLHEQPTGQFAQDRDWVLPSGEIQSLLRDAVQGHCELLDATKLATALMGDAIATNLFMLGFAYQRGRVPVTRDSIEQAIELNAVAVQANLDAFSWGRRAAVDLDAVKRIAWPGVPMTVHRTEPLEQLIESRAALLESYQDARYAASYRLFISKVEAADRQVDRNCRLTRTVARSLAKLMAYKDEYEVARLFSGSAFKESLEGAFQGKPKLRFNLAPPLLASRDSQGRLLKREYGGWLSLCFPLLARLKVLRGSRLDPFGWTAERSQERVLITEYKDHVLSTLAGLDASRYERAIAIAAVPESIRGFGHVKEIAIKAARSRWAALRNETALNAEFSDQGANQSFGTGSPAATAEQASGDSR